MLWFSGGLAMFLVGMVWMRQGVEQLGQKRLRSILSHTAGRKFGAVFSGFLVTLLLQSSSATTVILVGLVAMDAIGLRAAVAMQLGANVGTTVTAQLIRLMDVHSAGWLLQIFQAQQLAPLLWIVGGILIVFRQGTRPQAIGLATVGLGLLFTGILTMRQAVTPLLDAGWFSSVFDATVRNPLAAFAAGLGVALLVQSSSAAVGILQSLCVGESAPVFWQVWPILLGISIGGALATSLLCQIRATGNAKRTAIAFLLINVLGALCNLLMVLLLRVCGAFVWDTAMDAGRIADLHTFFRLSSAIVLYPLLEQLASFLMRFGQDA